MKLFAGTKILFSHPVVNLCAVGALLWPLRGLPQRPSVQEWRW